MRVCLFEDRAALGFEPLTLTRPVFELLCGLTSLATKQAQFFTPQECGVLVRPTLAEVYRQERPSLAVNDPDWLREGPTVLVNGRWLPPTGSSGLLDPTAMKESFVALVGDEVAYASLSPELLADCSPENLDECLQTWKTTLPCRRAGGMLFSHLWEVVQHNAEQITQDWECYLDPVPSREAPAGWGVPECLAQGLRPGFLSSSPTVVGPQDRLVLDPTARIDPMVLADTTGGPILIDRDAVITAFTRLEGPCYIGPRTQVMGARVRAGTTLGPECRIGGEVEASIVQGYSNKYHDGFLGHAYLGEWINLGAGTQNSDLRNDYGEVRVMVQGRLRATRLTKVGCFVGDHSKTALGTLLNTGTNVGIFCNLLPARLLPRHIPSFARCADGVLVDCIQDISPLLETAMQVMQRRGRELTRAHRALYDTLFHQTAEERRQALRAAESRQLRRSA